MTRERYGREFERGRLAAPAGGALLAKVSDFGLFATVLLSVSLGLTVFCVSCCVAIFTLLAYNQLGHHAVNFADTYKFVALPAGSVTTVLSFLFLFALWLRRKFRDSPRA